jgi:hypothetical protein
VTDVTDVTAKKPKEGGGVTFIDDTYVHIICI